MGYRREDRTTIRIPAIRSARPTADVPGYRAEPRWIEGGAHTARTNEADTDPRTGE